MDEDTLLPFDFQRWRRKKVSVAFDGGMLSSDGGVLLLRDVERRLGHRGASGGMPERSARPDRIDHTLVEMLRLRMFVIAAGYEDANDCTTLRAIPCSRWR